MALTKVGRNRDMIITARTSNGFFLLFVFEMVLKDTKRDQRYRLLKSY